MKVYVQIANYGKVKVRTKESLEREKQRLYQEYLDGCDMFEEFLNDHFTASDFYKKEPNEEEIKEKFAEYCESCARYDTFGQYKETIVDEDEESKDNSPF